MPRNYHLLKQNEGYLKIESERISSYLNDKYKNDEEFREKKKQYQKEYRERKKLERQMALQARTETLPDLIMG